MFHATRISLFSFCLLAAATRVPSAAQPQSVNLIADPGFESGNRLVTLEVLKFLAR